MPSSDLEARHVAAFSCPWCISMREATRQESHFCHLKSTPHHHDLALLISEASAHCLLPDLCRALPDLSPKGPSLRLPTPAFTAKSTGFYVYGQPLPHHTSSPGVKVHEGSKSVCLVRRWIPRLIAGHGWTDIPPASQCVQTHTHLPHTPSLLFPIPTAIFRFSGELS